MSNLIHVACASPPLALTRVGAVRTAKGKHGWRNLVLANGTPVGAWCKGPLCIWRDVAPPEVVAAALPANGG